MRGTWGRALCTLVQKLLISTKVTNKYKVTKNEKVTEEVSTKHITVPKVAVLKSRFDDT